MPHKRRKRNGAQAVLPKKKNLDEKKGSELQNSDSEDEGEYEIEKIIDHKISLKDQHIEFLV